MSRVFWRDVGTVVDGRWGPPEGTPMTEALKWVWTILSLAALVTVAAVAIATTRDDRTLCPAGRSPVIYFDDGRHCRP